jgi:Fur family ferric uptake transcriptional regulator
VAGRRRLRQARNHECGTGEISLTRRNRSLSGFQGGHGAVLRVLTAGFWYKSTWPNRAKMIVHPTTKSDHPMNEKPHNLKDTGLKVTGPRQTILALFQNAQQRHMSAEDVYKLLLADHANIGLATVYRVLTQFEQAGILSRSNFENGKAVFELNEGHHHDHIVCMDCGRVEEFFDAEIEARQKKIAKAQGFDIEDHALSLYARCIKNACPFKK